MKIILASTSPRRIDLLKQVGLNPIVVAPDADETPRRGESPSSLVARLARAKANSVAEGEPDGPALIISADTIVVEPKGKRILGKPKSEADACLMLRSLQGKAHTVLTGYCIHPVGISGARPRTRVIRSRVKMRKLSRAEILAYVATREPMDKAGSYAAQGVGMGLIDSISGSYSNVVGLPLSQLLTDLESFFGLRFLGAKK